MWPKGKLPSIFFHNILFVICEISPMESDHELRRRRALIGWLDGAGGTYIQKSTHSKYKAYHTKLMRHDGERWRRNRRFN